MIRIVVSLIWLVFAGLVGSDAALAHAALIESHPFDGEVVEVAPATVRLRFNEPVSPLVINLTDAEGRVHRDLDTGATNAVLEIPLPPTPPGATR